MPDPGGAVAQRGGTGGVPAGADSEVQDPHGLCSPLGQKTDAQGGEEGEQA